MEQLDLLAQCDEIRRFSRQAESILSALATGPKTGDELGRIARRYGARIHELRKAGYRITLTHHNRATGETVYEWQP